MKAKLVSENISFERTGDPLDSLEIGQKKLRSIRKDLRDISPVIESAKAEGDLDFRNFRWKIDNLKNIMEFVIINHINENYNLGVELVERKEERGRQDAENLFAEAHMYNNNHLYLYKNGPGNAFWFILESPKLLHNEKPSQSYNLSTFDSKLKRSLKRAGVL